MSAQWWLLLGAVVLWVLPGVLLITYGLWLVGASRFKHRRPLKARQKRAQNRHADGRT